MFEGNPERQRISRNLSIIPVFLAFAWGIVGFHIFATAPRFPDSANGQTQHIYYKSTDIYVSELQYYLLIGLPFVGFLSIPLIVMITSPRLGLFKYDN